MNSKEFINQYVVYDQIIPNNVDEISDTLDLSHCGLSKIENLPKRVLGGLNLSYNQIEKIENLPEYNGGLFCISNNRINKIENLPDCIDGNLDLSYNNITKIENLPSRINGFLNLVENNIRKIENFPKHVTNIHLNGNDIHDYEMVDSDFEMIYCCLNAMVNKDFHGILSERVKNKNIQKLKELF